MAYDKKAYKARWYKENGDRVRQRVRDHMLFKRYGITRKQYNEMSISQLHKCAICFIDVSLLKRGLMVDHDHTTSKVRALLCDDCNNGLGRFKDNIKNMRKAIRYLQKHENK